MPTNPVLNEHIDMLNLPVRAHNALICNSIDYICQLVQLSERRFMEFRGVSKTSLDAVKAALAVHGLRLGMVIRDMPDVKQREAELMATIERLTRERDEARKWSCMWESLAHRADGAKAVEAAKQMASERGWDCFVQEGFHA